MGRKNKSKKHQQKQVEKRLDEENLDRFAGSSDEDEGGDDFDGHPEETLKKPRKEIYKDGGDDESSSSDVMMEQQGSKGQSQKSKGIKKEKASDSYSDGDDGSSDVEKKHSRHNKNRHIDGDGLDGDLEESSDSESDSEEEDDDELGNATKAPAAKMADAMARILGAGNIASSQVKKKTSTVPVILSKTTTPLQRQALEEKKQLQELKAKRTANRERNLSALHIPLSVATTVNIVDTKSDTNLDGGSSGSKLSSITEELEQERLHRRVATRGVVALFNAISQHQKGGGSANNVSSDEEVMMKKSKNSKDSKLTKHGFLENLKSTAAAAANKGKATSDKNSTTGGNASDDDESSKKTGKSTTSKPQWNALKDDFMLNPKKNWDEELSDDDAGSFNDGQVVDVDDDVNSDNNDGGEPTIKKGKGRGKTSASKGPNKRRRVGGRQ